MADRFIALYYFHSVFVWAPTWLIATVVKVEVTWVKTKNLPKVFSSVCDNNKPVYST